MSGQVAAPRATGFARHTTTYSSHSTTTTSERFNRSAAGAERGQGAAHSYHHNSSFGHAVAGAAVGAAVVGAAAAHGGHAHYSEQAYPHEIHAQQHYQWRGQWNQPHGYYYRHWGYGDHLPWGWFGRSYWITDFGLYGLPIAPYGYAWVREGPDAVLVNVYNGEVVEVDYGVFY